MFNETGAGSTVKSAALSPELKRAVEKKNAVGWAIWSALSVSIAIMMIIPVFMPVAAPIEEQASLLLRLVLVFCALIDATISYAFYKYRERKSFLRRRVNRQGGLECAEEGQLSGAAPAEEEKMMPEADRRMIPILNTFFSMWVINLALNESVAVMGLVASLLAQALPTVVPFGILALLLNLMMPPKFDRLAIELRSLKRS